MFCVNITVHACNPNMYRLRQENYREIEASPGYIVRSSLKRKRERKEKKTQSKAWPWVVGPLQTDVIKMKEITWEAEAIGDCFEFELRLGYVVSSGPA